MRRRMVGLAVSVLLALFGTAVLVGYAQSAHDKAGAAEPTVPVLVVKTKVEKGTKASDLGDRVKVVEVARNEKVDGAVASASELAGKVASTELLPGEQVLAERFVTREAVGRQGVPKGLLEVTVELAPDRALGGAIQVGDHVAVIASFQPFDLDATGQPADPNGPKKTPDSTHIILHKALVTHVQAESFAKGSTSKSNDQETAQPDPRPKGSLLVTLAVDAGSVERVVFTAEFGKLWLAAEPSDAGTDGTAIQTRGSVYQ